MAEDLNIITGTKAEQYESLLPQIKGLLEGEPDLIANLANVVAALKEQFGWLWVGFYLVKPAVADASSGKENELVLAPFQGPVACTRIKKEEVFAAQVGKKHKQSLFLTLKNFRDTLLAAVYQNRKLLYPLFVMMK